MNNIFGIKGVKIKVFGLIDTFVINEFLSEYDGNIIDIQTCPCDSGSKIVVVYHDDADKN